MSPNERLESWREAATMVLYLSIVLLATLAALPTGSEGADGHGGSGVHGLGLVRLIWGTTIGLALAHWLSFRLAARVFGGGELSEQDVRIGFAQVGGAALVAGLCTIPVLAVGDADEVRVTSWVPALIVGLAGYAVSRVVGRAKVQSLFVGGVVMLLGLTVAAVKDFLLGH